MTWTLWCLGQTRECSLSGKRLKFTVPQFPSQGGKKALSWQTHSVFSFVWLVGFFAAAVVLLFVCLKFFEEMENLEF